MLAVFSLAFSIIAFIPRTKGSMFVTVCNAAFFILFLFKFSALRGFFLFFSHLLSHVKNKECILIGHSCFFHICFVKYCFCFALFKQCLVLFSYNYFASDSGNRLLPPADLLLHVKFAGDIVNVVFRQIFGGVEAGAVKHFVGLLDGDKFFGENFLGIGFPKQFFGSELLSFAYILNDNLAAPAPLIFFFEIIGVVGAKVG